MIIAARSAKIAASPSKPEVPGTCPGTTTKSLNNIDGLAQGGCDFRHWGEPIAESVAFPGLCATDIPCAPLITSTFTIPLNIVYCLVIYGDVAQVYSMNLIESL